MQISRVFSGKNMTAVIYYGDWGNKSVHFKLYICELLP